MKRLTMLFIALVFIGSIFVINNENAQAADFEKASAKKIILVKSEPGESYKTLGKIKAKTSVKVYGGVPIGKDQENASTADQYGWSKIMYNGKYAYVPTHELKFEHPSAWAPGVKAQAIAEIKEQFVSKNDKIRLVYDRNSYYEVFVQKDGKGEYQYLVYINCKTGWWHG